jgi:hypothetical protein
VAGLWQPTSTGFQLMDTGSGAILESYEASALDDINHVQVVTRTRGNPVTRAPAVRGRRWVTCTRTARLRVGARRATRAFARAFARPGNAVRRAIRPPPSSVVSTSTVSTMTRKLSRDPLRARHRSRPARSAPPPPPTCVVVQVLPNSDYVILNGRLTDNFCKYSRATSECEWIVGGEKGTLTIVDFDGVRHAPGEYTAFYGQHNLEYFGEGVSCSTRDRTITEPRERGWGRRGFE